MTATTAEIGATLVDGTIELELDELIPVAKELVAVTVNVYAVPLVKPVTVADVPVVVAVTLPGADVTVYWVVAAPPLDAGAVHETVARRFPGIADTLVGGDG